MVRRLFLALALMAFGGVFAVPMAQAEFGISRWEALTCKSDATVPGLGNWAAAGSPCIKSEVERQYTQAAGTRTKASLPSS